MSQAPDILGHDSRPSLFSVGNAHQIGLSPPESRGGVPVRTWVRALAGMQKEALIVNGSTGAAWRLTSDEGPYLAGYDRAPCPLCHFITGMVSSYAGEMLNLAQRQGASLTGLEVGLDTFYTMQGSALKGTMVGGALNQLSVDADGVSETELLSLVGDATLMSPLNGLLVDRLHGLFTLHHNGESLSVGSVLPVETPPQPDPRGAFDDVQAVDEVEADDLMVRVTTAAQVEGVPGGVNTSYQESQSRSLQLHAQCSIRADGVKEVTEHLISPIGSVVRFMSDEAPGFGGSGLAPDAAAYLSAGLAFCFMTQFGRYATITRRPLNGYRIVQDTHFYPGSEGIPGRMDPVETHVFLESSEDDDYARRILDMAEQTCFLHATCRSELGIEISVSGHGRRLD